MGNRNYIWEEELINYFNMGFASVLENNILGPNSKSLKIRRDSDSLILTSISTERPKNVGASRPAGTLYKSTDTIVFKSTFDDATITASNVVDHGFSFSHKAGQETEFSQEISAYSLEMARENQKEHAYTIEWIDNIRLSALHASRFHYEEEENLLASLGSGTDEITIRRNNRENSGGASALHIKFRNISAYLLKASSGTNEKKGHIVYKGSVDENSRNKIRDCLSFALGIPIIYYGHTNYDEDWNAISMKSYGGFTMGGAMLDLIEQPPFPLYSTYLNVVDQSVLNGECQRGCRAVVVTTCAYPRAVSAAPWLTGR